MSRERQLKILLVGLNYSPEIVGIAVYTAGLAEDLVRRGHSVEVIAGKPYYPEWSIVSEYKGGWRRKSVENGVTLTRVAHYVPANPSGLRRLVHHFTFAVSSFLPAVLRARRIRPDVVLAVAPSLVGAPVAKIAAALSGAKSWLHVQDFEVEAAMATGLMDVNGPGGRVARWFENKVLRTFDRVSSISPAMCMKLIHKGVRPEAVVEFRNWADLDHIAPLSESTPYRAEWGLGSRHVALYSGNIANKQGIEIVIQAAHRLRHRNDIVFVVCGNGPNREKLQMQAGSLHNIVFHDLQPKERLSDLLCLASVHLLPQIENAADLVLPSKLTNMLASGRPVVATAAAGTGLFAEVDGCGILVPPGDEVAFAASIEKLVDSEEMRNTLGKAARRRAQERWARDAIIDGFEIALRHAATENVAGSATPAIQRP